MKRHGVFDMPGTHTNIMERALIPKDTAIVRFFPRTPPETTPLSRNRCHRCHATSYVIRAENRICTSCGDSYYYEPDECMGGKIALNARVFNHNTNKRISHFKAWIARLQGKERCAITSSELQAVEERYHRLPDCMSEYVRIKTVLRQLGLQKYYNHIYFIQRSLLGYALVEFRKVNEARLLAMFLRIQEPFARLQKGRTNMISYQFLIRKFCQLLGYKIADYIPLLKSKANLQRQDMIWKLICEELEIPFYPSV